MLFLCIYEALILGTGGASKAVVYALKSLGIESQYVSRQPKSVEEDGIYSWSYDQLDAATIERFKLIVNCTPLGTYPDIERYPVIPFVGMGKDHFVYDLIYNPKKTAFLKKAEVQQAQILNGLRMLELQAEAAWEIWNTH